MPYKDRATQLEAQREAMRRLRADRQAGALGEWKRPASPAPAPQRVTVTPVPSPQPLALPASPTPNRPPPPPPANYLPLQPDGMDLALPYGGASYDLDLMQSHYAVAIPHSPPASRYPTPVFQSVPATRKADRKTTVALFFWLALLAGGSFWLYRIKSAQWEQAERKQQRRERAAMTRKANRAAKQYDTQMQEAASSPSGFGGPVGNGEWWETRDDWGE